MDIYSVFASGLGVGVALLLIVILLNGKVGSSPARIAFSGLMLAALAFFLHPLLSSPYTRWTMAIQTSAPAIFWITCHLIFSPRPRMFQWISWVALYSAIPPAIVNIGLAGQEIPPAVNVLAKKIPQVLEYVLILLAFKEINFDYGSDLIQSRRRLRVGLQVVVGVTLFGVILSFNYKIGGDCSRQVVMIIALLIIAVLVLENREEIFVNQPSESSLNAKIHQQLGYEHPITADDVAKIASSSEQFLELEMAVSEMQRPAEDNQKASENLSAEVNESLAKLQVLVSQGFYRQEQLTLKKLSKQIQIPEYKLRKLINGHLGYGNFNDYIRELRIAEANMRLINEPDTPISNIALDLGFRTLSSFNRAFRDINETTPTEYRKAHSHS
jgi:AraC-like DNA-binding protein